VVPTVTQATQPLEQLAESLLWSLPGQLQKQFDDWTIGVWTRLIVKDRTLQTDGTTSAPFTQSMLGL